MINIITQENPEYSLAYSENKLWTAYIKEDSHIWQDGLSENDAVSKLNLLLFGTRYNLEDQMIWFSYGKKFISKG